MGGGGGTASSASMVEALARSATGALSPHTPGASSGLRRSAAPGDGNAPRSAGRRSPEDEHTERGLARETRPCGRRKVFGAKARSADHAVLPMQRVSASSAARATFGEVIARGASLPACLDGQEDPPREPFYESEYSSCTYITSVYSACGSN